MRWLSVILGLVIFLVGLGLALKNRATVVVYAYLGNAWEAPLSLVLFLSFTLGILTGLVVFLGVYVKQKRQLLMLQRRESQNTST